MALIGNLKDLKLPSLIQLNCMERNNAKLTVERNGKFGFVYFEEGQVTHAEYDPLLGEEAVYKLLTLLDGKFKVESGVKPPVRTIHVNWSNLLLEGMHKLDHAQDNVDNSYYRLFERLMTIKGVFSVCLIDKEGNCLDHTELNESADQLPNTAFIMLQGQRVGDALKQPIPDFICLLSNKKRYILVVNKENYLLLEIDPKVKSDTVLPLIKQALG